jgi:hypothetical protein
MVNLPQRCNKKWRSSMDSSAMSSVDGKVTVSFDSNAYSDYLKWMADTKERNVAKKLKDAGSKVVGRRQTLVMRRVDVKTIAPDEDIAAYGEIHNLKNPSADPKQKTTVTDNEIKAYKDLDPEFKLTVTLEAVKAKVEELKDTGQLTTDGDVAEEIDETDGAEA